MNGALILSANASKCYNVLRSYFGSGAFIPGLPVKAVIFCFLSPEVFVEQNH